MSLDVNTEYTIYFAGALFDHKELIGNAILASYINEISDGKYRCILPQDLEQSTNRAVDIRNQDLSYVLACDLAIFNFDGAAINCFQKYPQPVILEENGMGVFFHIKPGDK